MTFEEAIAELGSLLEWAEKAAAPPLTYSERVALRIVLDVVAEWTTTATPDPAGEAS